MGQIEERTILRVGKGSLMVTLPKGWVRFYGLQAGDKVIVISDGILKIKPKAKRDKNSVISQKSEGLLRR